MTWEDKVTTGAEMASDFNGLISDYNSLTVESLAALASINNARVSKAFLNLGGRSGDFIWDGSDLSAEVAVDTLQGVYVAGSGDASGAGGAWVRKLDGFVTPEMFGAVGDAVYNEELFTSSGTDNAVALQSSINTGYDLKIIVRILGRYGHVGEIIIPDNSNVEGVGKGVSGFYKVSSANDRGVIVGTYGPGNGAGSPAANGYNAIDLAERDGFSITLSNAGDASNFSIGDIIGIEGSGTLYGTFQLPNMVTEVATISGAVLGLKDALDDVGYIRVCILNKGTGGRVDQTGRNWPLAVAVNTKVSNMTIQQSYSSGWAAVNLSTYKTLFEDMEFKGLVSLAGNPVAKTLFNRCDMEFTRACFEFAYYSHNTKLTECTGNRVRDQSNNGVACWANAGEGAKRIDMIGFNFQEVDVSNPTATGLIFLGRDSLADNCIIKTKQPAVRGGAGSRIVSSVIYWGGGFGLNGFDGGSIINNKILSATEATGEAVLLNSDDTPIVTNNQVGRLGAKTPVDIIFNQSGSDRSKIDNNETFKTVIPLYNVFDNSLPESGGEVELGELAFTAGQIFERDETNFNSIYSAPSGTNLVLRINDGDTITVPLSTLGNSSVSIRIFAGGGGDTRFRYEALVNDGDTIIGRSGAAFAPVAWNLITSISLHIVGVATSDSVTRRSIEAIHKSHRHY